MISQNKSLSYKNMRAHSYNFEYSATHACVRLGRNKTLCWAMWNKMGILIFFGTWWVKIDGNYGYLSHQTNKNQARSLDYLDKLGYSWPKIATSPHYTHRIELFKNFTNIIIGERIFYYICSSIKGKDWNNLKLFKKGIFERLKLLT